VMLRPYQAPILFTSTQDAICQSIDQDRPALQPRSVDPGRRQAAPAPGGRLILQV